MTAALIPSHGPARWVLAVEAVARAIRAQLSRPAYTPTTVLLRDARSSSFTGVIRGGLVIEGRYWTGRRWS